MLANSQWRKTTSSDSSLSKRDKKLAKMVSLVSLLFILFFLPTAVNLIAMLAVPEYGILGEYEVDTGVWDSRRV